MKWTIGHTITLAFIVFATFILFMVSKMINTKVDLVEKDYYAKEIKFQNQINKYQNTVQLGDSAVIIQQTDDKIIIQIHNNPVLSANVFIYYPANEEYDKKLSFNNTQNIIIDKNNIHKGRAKIKLDWNDTANEYYFEKELLIN